MNIASTVHKTTVNLTNGFALKLGDQRKIFLNVPIETSSETQGQIVGAGESLNRRENMAQEKSKER